MLNEFERIRMPDWVFEGSEICVTAYIALNECIWFGRADERRLGTGVNGLADVWLQVYDSIRI